MKSEAELLADVLRLHRCYEEEAIVAPDCVSGDCGHENECPTGFVAVCAHCFDMIEAAYSSAFEEDGEGWRQVIWPCATAMAAGVPFP